MICLTIDRELESLLFVHLYFLNRTVLVILYHPYCTSDIVLAMYCTSDIVQAIYCTTDRDPASGKSHAHHFNVSQFTLFD